MEVRFTKNFDEWNKSKKSLNNRDVKIFCHEREIWWSYLGVNIGYEEDGTGDIFQRPVLIIKMLSPRTCLVAPLTSSKSFHKMRIPLGIIADKNASAILSQIRVIDTRRLLSKICYLNEHTFVLIRKNIRDMF